MGSMQQLQQAGGELFYPKLTDFPLLLPLLGEVLLCSTSIFIETSVFDMTDNSIGGMNVAKNVENVEIVEVIPNDPPTSTTDTSTDKANNTMPPQSTSMEVSSSSTSSSLTSRIWTCAQWTGLKVFYTMDYIGEIVCRVLGLDESRYQYVIDGMDDNDWRQAREIQARKDRAARGEV